MISFFKIFIFLGDLAYDSTNPDLKGVFIFYTLSKPKDFPKSLTSSLKTSKRFY